jgi:hypothetical protein
MLRKRMESQVHLHEAQAAFRSKDPTDNCACSRILQEAGQQNCHAFFLTCAKRMIRSGGMAIRQVARERWMESYGSCETHIKSTSQVRVNGDLSEAFPLSAGVGQGDPYLRCCSISLSMTPWLDLHDTCSEHGICMGQTDVASLLYADDECTILHPNGLQS